MNFTGGKNWTACSGKSAAWVASTILWPAVREKHKQISSNVVWTYDYDTIPRHLRDIVITEYGIADLRGKSDEECVKAMLGVCDARFQGALMEKAKKYGKLDKDWQLPPHFANNTPENLSRVLATYRQHGLFPAYPHGCDCPADKKLLPFLQRMELDQPATLKEKLSQRLLVLALQKSEQALSPAGKAGN